MVLAPQVVRGALGAVGLCGATSWLVACDRPPDKPPAEIVAVKVPLGSNLGNPEAPFWRSVPEARVPMLPQNVAPPFNLEPAVQLLGVRAAYDGELLAIRMEWEDPTESMVNAADSFGDQVAIQFPLDHGKARATSPMMGHQGAPVRVLQWRSMLQWELAHGVPTIGDFYPNAVVDLYPDSLLAGEVAAPYTGGRGVGNPVSQPRLLSPVVSHIAEGWGTLTDAPDQRANGSGVWRAGRWRSGTWRVSITHPLARASEPAESLRPGMQTAIAFAVWDGGNREVGSRKAWATWIPIRIAE